MIRMPVGGHWTTSAGHCPMSKHLIGQSIFDYDRHWTMFARHCPMSKQFDWSEIYINIFYNENKLFVLNYYKIQNFLVHYPEFVI